MSDINLKPILEHIKGRETGSVYGGSIPNGIKKIMRVSTGIFDYTEVVFENLEEELLKQIVRENGLNYEKKKQSSQFGCGCVKKFFERINELEGINTYTITKPRKFWFPVLIADVVDNSVRVYDTQTAIETSAVLLEQYLEGERSTYANL